MLKNILQFFLTLLFLIIATPANSIDYPEEVIQNYTIKISKKFSNTYCNTTKFGISNEGALRFSIGETNKEFSNNKLNKYIDYELLKSNILLNLEKNCKIFGFPENELENLDFAD